MNRPIDVEAVRARLATEELGRVIEHLERVGSTNDVALASEGPSGMVVVAEEQERGRGREGREWVAPRGSSLLVSVLLRWPELGPSLPRLTLAAAVAVCASLRDVGLTAPRIKWPNDVLAGGRKLAGILCESRSRGGVVEAIVVGIGLNVNQRRDALPPVATSILEETGVEVDRVDLLARLLGHLEEELLAVRDGRFDEVRRRWEGFATMHRGHRVRVVVGGSIVEGVSDGLDGDGAIGVRLDDGSRIRVLSGEVVFLPPEG